MPFHSGLLALLFFFASSNLFVGILEVLIYPLILSFASPSQLGTILFIGGVGMLAGSLLMSTWGNGRQNYINTLFCFMLLNAFCMMVVGMCSSVFLFDVAAFLYETSCLTLFFLVYQRDHAKHNRSPVAKTS